MLYQIGQRIMTPDQEQGFVSAVYYKPKTHKEVIDWIEVDILEDDAVSPDDTTMFSYEPCEGVEITDDQRPRIDDITPIGLVKSVAVVIDGILGVKVVEGKESLVYDGFWLSDKRMEYLTGYGEIEPLCHHWLETGEDFLTFIEVFDLVNGSGGLRPKPIHHHATPETCELEVQFEDEHVELWNAHVSGAGKILEIMPDTDGRPEKITTLAELRATGALEITLVSKYSIRGF